MKSKGKAHSSRFGLRVYQVRFKGLLKKMSNTELTITYELVNTEYRKRFNINENN